MANRAYLIGTNDDLFATERPRAHTLLEARYFMPVLWLALFKDDDIHVDQGVPFPLTGRSEALANFDARRAGLAKFLGGDADRLLGQFRDFVAQHTYAHYLINTHELKIMEDAEGEFHAELREYLDDMYHLGLGDQEERRLMILWQSNKKLADYPSDLTPYFLCGTSSDHPMPWEPKQAA